jgi:hypothetical protein
MFDVIDTSRDNLLVTYLDSFYFLIETLSSVGYGEIVPTSTSQMIFIMVLQLVGLSVFSYYRSMARKLIIEKSSNEIVMSK